FAFASNSAYREVAHCQEPLVETIGAMVMGRGVNYDRLLIPVMIGDRPGFSAYATVNHTVQMAA
ncbi:MAG: hypothetical protein AAF441_20445, partial [Pseudomonadota bacterium]